MSRDVVLVDGVRTPYCRANTDLRDVPAVDLGRIPSVELFARTGLAPERIDEAIFGNIATPVDAANIARVIALRAGVPESVPAFTVGRNCGSGAEAIADAFLRIRGGFGEVMLAGGVESMSQIPLLFGEPAKRKFLGVFGAKSAGARIRAAARFRPADFKPVVGLELGLTDPVCDLNMGQTAEVLAKDFGISREEQDAYALRSHQRATAARAKLAEEIVPVPVPPRYDRLATIDNGVRENQTMEALAKLRPFFDRKFGTVTAGNSSQITDGGAAVLVASLQAARGYGLRPIGYVRSFAFAGTDPARMGLGPALAVPIALKRAGIAWKDVGLVELNEAFAAQVLACARVWNSAEWHAKHDSEPIGELDFERTNVNGGAIALGHPVGSTGTRLVITLLREMRRRQVQFGIATMCIGGGQGGAVVVELAS
jgi:acetyl-CoA acetyltransferase family protein